MTTALEVLPREACLQLLHDQTIGRLALTDRALPTILPVNYWFDGASIFVRTNRGSKLDAAMRDAVVAFEVDDVDRVEHTGWSVVVTGIAREVTDPDELRQLERAPIARWAPGWDGHVMAISAQLVSGRRLGQI